MAFLEQKLNVKLAQKQILTPGLVQMVTVLALNKLELSDMISQELMANPVLEEEMETTTNIEETQIKEERSVDPVDKEIIESGAQSGERADLYEQIEFGSSFDDCLDPGDR